MKRIAVLTSGGDAPGMNAAIRAVVEQGAHHGIEVVGVNYGFKGLVEGDFRVLSVADCQDKIRRGGTFLYSARFPEFKEKEVQLKAIEQMKQHGIEALVAIGGDGTFTGALQLQKHGYPVVGIPGTIDNDIPGTEYTIGFDTAVNVALEEIDKISDTASSHNRTFVVEVMGRHAGDIAVWAGVAAGADAIVIPESGFDMKDVVRRVHAGRAHGKDHSMIILAEGVMDVETFVKQFRETEPEMDIRGVALAHVQRGGNPTARDRVFATLMGARAVDCLLNNEVGIFMGVRGEQLATFDIIETLEQKSHAVRQDLYELNQDITDKPM
ncbi:6-phosphofructokinase [Aerococcaceae bacterium zg-ZJ1578]|uniref:6-phosphofructokinase n=1 Tax=Aerococcaceae TaxID=186827 RepID=UPI0013B836C4|nr:MULTISPECIES: 6-phosphofructokinase [unclassified Facklamia]MBK0348095.1 6-phosphofructokinase [Aerococcaceae bacterium zg-1578]MBR7927214.1 6-phosphofructokinase [Aerococcaceae bacterium zg-ZUI334]MBS4462603.1 6-phosphofructokinase [Aerococcaceae bacterium zg-B36]QQD66266.1 6-phosphofructokinase [Aerococcaceae bacterium zg-252]NEW63723.1 6-phosphofructokinase [Facklamia sp. 252]